MKTFIINLEKGAKIRKRPQDENFATYYCPNYPNNFLINWKQTVTYIYNYIRASHFPSFYPAFFIIQDIKVGITFPLDYTFQKHHFPIGKIIEHNGKFCITALNGFIIPIHVMIDKELMDFKYFVNNNDLLDHTIL